MKLTLGALMLAAICTGLLLGMARTQGMSDFWIIPNPTYRR